MGGNKKGGANDKAQDVVPTLLPMVQKKLNDLVGQTSGYLESLPKNVQNRVRALKKLQKEKDAVDEEYKKEKEALELKFKEKFSPLYNKRAEIVNGAVEPEWIEPEKKEGEEKKEEVKAESKTEGKEDVKGIPDFWLNALQHHRDVGDLITEKDAEALKYIKDVVVKSVKDEKHSFTLEFSFSENPFFENAVLSKTYHLFEHPALGEIMFDRVDASDVKWKSGKDLTVRTVTKTQGGNRGGRRGGKRGGGAPKTVTVQEPAPSFFNFFKPDAMLIVPEPDDEPLEEEEMEGMLEFDYEIGCVLKDVIIPNALNWFTGEAAEGMDDFDDEEGDEEDGEEDEDDEEDDDEEDGATPAATAPGTGEAKPECKQQ